MATRLREPVLEHGIRNTHFFNGRLLTAEDLQAEQTARREQQRRLGLAIGGGVVRGLEVSVLNDRLLNPLLRISQGMAITPGGQLLTLGADIDLAWAQQAETLPPQAGVFGDCEEVVTNTAITGEGLYILTLTAASGLTGRAPASGLGAEGRITGCGSRYEVEGVALRAVKLVLNDIPGLDSATLARLGPLLQRTDLPGVSLLRSHLAQLCLGGATLAAAAADPLGRGAGPPPAAHGGLLAAIALRAASPSVAGDVEPQLATRRLTDCEVPLALIYWSRLDPNPNPVGIQFVDMWAVRRHPATAPAASSWPLNLALGDPAVGAARLAQFADQLAWLQGRLSAGQLATARAIDYLRFLPAAGVVPLSAPNRPGFAYPQFFAGIPHRNNGPQPGETAPFVTGVPILEGAAAEALFRTALAYPAQELGELSAEGQPQRGFVWLFQLREQRQAIDVGGAGAPQPCLIFASGQLPELGEARFDRARWGYSNFA